jgi:hypothetical protein
MAYKACVSFSGLKISMAKGQIREISDTALVADLLKAGYIVPYEATDNKSNKTPTNEEPKNRRKGKVK